MTIPKDQITFNDDGTAWWVFDEHGPAPQFQSDRPCDTCGGRGSVRTDCGPECDNGVHEQGRCQGSWRKPCPADCIDGRHTFNIDVARPIDGWMPHLHLYGDDDCHCSACTGEACWQYHPFGEHCDHDSIDRHDGRECDDPEFRTLRVSIVPGMVLPIVADVGPVLDGRHVRITGGGIAWLAEPITGGGWKHTEITLPPAAAPGMWAVKLRVAS